MRNFSNIDRIHTIYTWFMLIKRGKVVWNKEDFRKKNNLPKKSKGRIFLGWD